MAGQAQPTITANVTALVALTAAVPAGKSESVCVLAAGSGGAADTYVTLVLTHPTFGPVNLLFQEPVRYRQPGGSPVLLQNFIIPEGCFLSVSAAPTAAYVTVYNRWLIDTVAGQNLDVIPFRYNAVTSVDVITEPAGKQENVCVLAALSNGSVADAYIDVVIIGTIPVYAALSEPVRYRLPGGSPVCLQDFILMPGNVLQLRGYAGQSVEGVVFNRWRFDA